MKISPEIQAVFARAIALHNQCRYREALDCMLALEARLPDHAGLLANLGVLFRDSGDLEQAEQYLRRAGAANPNDPAAHFNLAVTLLRAGRWREGFEEYEWRWQVPQFAEQRREFSQPLWRGEPLEGRRILIYGEQGAGDTIQFARYAPLVRDAGGLVTIEVLPHLERLLAWMDGEYRIVNALARGEQFDVQCPLMSLPQRFATELDSVLGPARFRIPAVVKNGWAGRLQSGRKNVGIVWAANPAYYNNAIRSMSARCFLPFCGVARVQCWSLQVGPSAADAPAGVENLSETLTDFGETAAAISELDLIVTVDTAVAHLAGTLGKPVWLLLAYASDWRWLMDRENTPWYPSMRIFRQRRPGDWDEVMERVVSELKG